MGKNGFTGNNRSMTNAFLKSGLFGNLFQDQTIAAEFGTDAFLARMCRFEVAWTRGLEVAGLIAPADAQAAVEAISGLSHRDFSAASDKDGLPVPGFVAVLRDGKTNQVAQAIHTGATSQDVIDTAMVLTCLDVLEKLDERLASLIDRLETLLNASGDVPLMARTRMQSAIPATVGLRVSSWIRPLANHQARTQALKQDLAHVQVGGAIGQRDKPVGHSEIVAEHVAQALGLSLGPVWHTDRTSLVGFGHWLTLVAGSLGKIGQDIALMAQQGVDEIVLDGGGGSSAMPHKQNPVLAEAMVALSRFVAHQQGLLGQAMIHEQERSGSAWSLEWMTLPAMAEATGAALRHGDGLIASIKRIGSQDTS